MIVRSEELKAKPIERFEKYRSRLRIPRLSYELIIDPLGGFFPNLLSHSSDADLTFLGLKKPDEGTSHAEYKEYYQRLLENTHFLNNVAFVLRGEKVKFRKIFL